MGIETAGHMLEQLSTAVSLVADCRLFLFFGSSFRKKDRSLSLNAAHPYFMNCFHFQRVFQQIPSIFLHFSLTLS